MIHEIAYRCIDSGQCIPIISVPFAILALALTSKAKGLERVDPREVLRSVRAILKSEREEAVGTEVSVTTADAWKEKLHSLLTQRLTP